MDKTFPTGDCAMCILSPKLVECARNKNIEIITLADVQGISGTPGNFKVKLRQNPRYVDLNKCNACGDCTDACPVDLPNEFDRCLGTRKAIFRPYPQAIPNVFGISKATGRAPCGSSCPAGVNAQGYVALIAAGKFKEAYELVRERCPLPAACGRVCQHPCEDNCNRGEIDQAVSIRDLKRFASDYVDLNPDQYPPIKPAEVKTGTRVAVIGGGPAGLTAAFDLTQLGYGVTIFRVPTASGRDAPVTASPATACPRMCWTGRSVDPGTWGSWRGRVPASPTRRPSSIPGSEPCSRPRAWGQPQPGHRRRRGPGVMAGLDFLRRINSGKGARGRPERACHRRRGRGHGRGTVCAPAPRRLFCARGLSRRPRGDAGPPLGGDRGTEEGIIFHNSLGPTRIETSGDKVTGVSFRTCTRVFDEQGRFAPKFDDSNSAFLATDTVIVTIGQGVDAAELGAAAGPVDGSWPTKTPWPPASPACSRAAMPCWDRPPWSWRPPKATRQL